MCLAIPGKVVEKDEKTVVVDYGFEKRKAKTNFITPNIGDYVLVSGGFVIEIVDETKAKEMIDAWNQISKT